MKSIQDALYNWLSIKVVCDKRKDDLAAVETEKFFYDILTEDYKISNIIIEEDEEIYTVFFTQLEKDGSYRYPRELIDMIINQINQEPEKYSTYL